MTLKVIIDGDSIPYSVGFAAKGEPLNYALQTVKNSLNKILSETGAQESELYMKGEGNFREAVAVTQTYKGNRKQEKPPHFNEIVEYMHSQHKAIKVDGMEADDKLSLLLYEDYVKAHGVKEECTLILSTIDKDLNCTPGWHHNPRTGAITFIGAVAAMRFFWWQMLVGDRVDNIPGLPDLPKAFTDRFGIRRGSKGGVGPKTATRLLEQTHSAESAEGMVWEAYLAWGHSEGFTDTAVKTYFLEQAQLLWMVRELDTFGDPVMYQINEELYERARRRSPYSTDNLAYGKGGQGGQQGDSGAQAAPDGYSSYSSSGGSGLAVGDNRDGRKSDDSDKHGESLRIQPVPSNS